MEKKRAVKLTFMILSIVYVMVFYLTNSSTLKTMANSSPSNESYTRLNTGMADVETLKSHYTDSLLAQKNSNMPIQIRLGWAKGLSSENSKGAALLTIDRFLGSISLVANNLPEGKWDLWLVNNVPGPGRSTLPEPGDNLIKAGSFRIKNGEGKLNTKLNNLENFRIDRTVIVREGQDPTRSFVLTGAPNLSERMELYPQIVAAKNEAARTASMEELIAKGRQLFLAETFSGNGRTCASCHREDRNFTIDPTFIATLPASDPLFVAESNPNLATNFEKPDMMRKFGLFVENADGFDDLTNKYTLRASSSILAVSTSIKAPVAGSVVDFTLFISNAPLQRLGWGGDGAPGSGTLREFAIGAVTQHMTKTLNRQAGTDFRLPTDDELDALEAFQLSLGRSEDIDIMKLVIKDDTARQGRDIFSKAEPDMGETKKCMECHFNGGATAGFDLIKSFCLTCNPNGANGTFDIGISNLKEAKKLGLPMDGGYGRMPLPTGGFGECVAGVCQGSFNVPPLVEAADTAPFFHNHLIATLEDAIAFYGTKTFDKSASGVMKLPDGRFDEKIKLNNKEIKRIAAFLRVLNILENIRSSVSMELRAQQMSTNDDIQQLIKLSSAETNDALEVITNGALAKDKAVAPALNNLNMAKTLLMNASSTSDINMKLVLLTQAIDQQRQARNALVDPTTLPSSFQN